MTLPVLLRQYTKLFMLQIITAMAGRQPSADKNLFGRQWDDCCNGVKEGGGDGQKQG